MNTIKPTVVRDTGTGGEEVISLNAWGKGWIYAQIRHQLVGLLGRSDWVA